MSTLKTFQSNIKLKLTPRAIDGRYIPYQVHEIADNIFTNASFEKLVTLFNEAIEMNSEHLINAIARCLAYKNSPKAEKFASHYSGKVAKFLKKHLKLREWGIEKEYSIADLITEKPNEFRVEDNKGRGALHISESITSLYGIKNISKVIDISSVNELELDWSDVLNKPILERENDPDFPEKPFKHFHALKTLKITEWQTLPSDLLFGISNLESLEIIGKQIATVPKSFFKGLHNLTILSLSGVFVTKLPESIFDDLGQLRILKLSLKKGVEAFALGYKVSLPADIFKKLSQLKFLDLSNCYIRHLPENIFASLSQLKILLLENNNLATLSPNIFQGLHSLEKLCLCYNSMETLPKKILRGLTNLKQFEMTNCRKLSFLPQSLFEGRIEIEMIDLRHNKLHKLPPEFFKDLLWLKNLYLYGSELKKIPTDLFQRLESLETLGLGNCFLKSLPPHIFDDLVNLKRLDLFANALTELPESVFSKLKKLVYLNLENNALKTISENVFQGVQEELTELNLEGNQISDLPVGIFKNLENLDKLNLGDNQLKTLPYDIFSDLVSLSHLDLFDNYMHYSDWFVRLPQITSLSISTLDPVIGEGVLWKRYLEYFSVSGKLRRLDEHHFKYLDGLKILTLNCQEVELPKNFPDLVPRLEQLNLNGTRIKGKMKKDIEKWFAKHDCVITL